jgi:hypothetical protein
MDGGVDAGSPVVTCAEAGSAGCCVGEVLYSCTWTQQGVMKEGTLSSMNCGAAGCGWDPTGGAAGGGAYACGGSGADPSGTYALTCAGPTTCAEAGGAHGCCYSGTAYYCDKFGTLQPLVCGVQSASPGPACGWDPVGAPGGIYACGWTGTDPSGTYPIACQTQ